MNLKDKRKYDREYHAKRSPAKKLHKQKLQNERRRMLRSKLIEFKEERPCECGEGHVACLEFHHVNGDKEISVANAVKRGWAWDRVLEEIAKCILVCANCHRKLHFTNVAGSNPAALTT